MNTSRLENGETVSNRQVGYGLVFGVPKSLSIYLAITGDQVAENIARSAVDETMRTLEIEMQCKVRKGCVLIGATATFGVFTLCTAIAGTLQQVLLSRFLAGVGLGGAMPSFISLAAEYTPQSNREVVVGLLWTGVPLGGVMAGLLESRLIDAVGWQSLFFRKQRNPRLAKRVVQITVAIQQISWRFTSRPQSSAAEF
jgi:MFS family permease